MCALARVCVEIARVREPAYAGLHMQQINPLKIGLCSHLSPLFRPCFNPDSRVPTAAAAAGVGDADGGPGRPSEVHNMDPEDRF